MESVSRGRPRSEERRLAILEATRDLIIELGYDKVNIDRIAQRAGSGKQTIYRWWPSKASIVADAITEGFVSLRQIPIPDSGQLRRDLQVWVGKIADSFADPAAVSMVRAMTAAAADSTDEATTVYERATLPVQNDLIARLEDGRDMLQLAVGADPAAIADALLGAVLFHVLTRSQAPHRLIAVVDSLVPVPIE